MQVYLPVLNCCGLNFELNLFGVWNRSGNSGGWCLLEYFMLKITRLLRLTNRSVYGEVSSLVNE